MERQGQLRARPDPDSAPEALLGPGDVPPFQVLNKKGRAPVLITGDHASNRMPLKLDLLGLEPEHLDQHISWDIGTRELVERLCTRLDAPAVIAGYSRLVADVNRRIESSTIMPPVSGGIRVPGNEGLTESQRSARLNEVYWPYHKRISRMLRGFRERGVIPALISIHSFTPELEGVSRPWHAGVLWDKDPRIAVPLMRKLAERTGLEVGDNQPYSGKHPHDFTVDHHAESAGFPHVSIETRQDLIGNSAGAESWAAVLGEVLAEILEDPGLFSIWEQ